MFPEELANGYWHTISEACYHSILQDGFIFPEPDFPCNRWGSAGGPEFYPFVRKVGGVSIFDFYWFEPESYSAKYPASSWHSFVPAQRGWSRAIWIKLSAEKMSGKFLSGSDLKTRQEESGALKNRLMPVIECAYLGAIPTSYFSNVLLYDESSGFSELN